MARYIDKDKVLNRLRYLCEVASEPPMDYDDKVKLKLLDMLQKEFAEIPTADVEEVKHAEWKEAEGGLFYCCTNCGYIVEYQLTSGCPNCRAKMDGGKEE